MRGKKVWVIGGVLVALGIVGWHCLTSDPASKLQRQYGVSTSQKGNTSLLTGNVLTQENLLISNNAHLIDAAYEEKLAQNASQVPSRENGWVAANTSLGVDDLIRKESAILLRNARLDTKSSTPLPIPAYLQAGEEPGCYIVQNNGAISSDFYRQLQEANIEVISYIPNNAALVAMTSEEATSIKEQFAAVLPYHPYYKLDPYLLEVALGENEEAYHAGTMVQVAVTPGHESDFSVEAKAAGLTILSHSDTQFGEVVLVQPDQEQVVSLAQSSNVHLMGVCRPRAFANDLSMIRLGIATNQANTDTYLNLKGEGFVNVNDSMVYTNHPALEGRITVAMDEDGDPILPDDTDEMVHGTHVMGTILGNGAESATVAGNANGSYEGADLSFKGAAPNATALYLPINSGIRAVQSDLNIIQWAAQTNYISEKRTNVLVSNNSWNFSQTPEYDLSASIFDGAVRDALYDVPGMQPILFVFSAGNEGYGDEEGASGNSDSILSPATAKNVITVGALESLRYIAAAHTNEVYATNEVDGETVISTNLVITTNTTLYNASDDEQQVASYSSRGNVGIGTEGTYGRIKPDIVAQGSYVVSTRGATETEEAPDTYEDIQIITDQFLDLGATNSYAFFAPTNIVSLSIEIITNSSSVIPLPDLSIRLKKGDRPGDDDFVGYNDYSTNFVYENPTEEEIEEAEDLSELWSTGYGDWYYSIVGSTNESASFDIILTMEIVYSDEEKSYYEDLKSASEALGEYYRYDSGTSMAAAAISGSLLLVQEFFDTYAPAGVTTPSPALLKALLINGSNPSGNRYSRKEAYGVNYQGWGIPSMTNIIPAALTNGSDQDTWPLWFVDQSPTNALATGENWEQLITVPEGVEEGNMKVTLVWTDPAANPNAGVKLVNNLDLVVSNVTTKTVYVGNNFPVNTDYNALYSFEMTTTTNDDGSISTNTVSTNMLAQVDAVRDSVNNVETVVIKGPLDTNYVLSVQARRVNVNAVSAHTNGLVQDFALVVSFQSMTSDFSSTNKFDLDDTEEDKGIMGTNLWLAPIDIVTNSVALIKQRVGGNSPLLATDDVYTNGVASQWHFYVFTNIWWEEIANSSTNITTTTNDDGSVSTNDVSKYRVGGPNVAFATFSPPNLSTPIRLNNADIDMYVSTNDALTNLDADVIQEAVENGWSSRKQGGSELFYITNATENMIFYVGIKSEDQKASEYSFVGISSEYPFSENDNGNSKVRFNPGSVWVPDGSPDEPGGTYLFGVSTIEMVVDTVIVTNEYLAQNAGDLYVALSHEITGGDSNTVVLHNHSFFTDDLNPVYTNEVERVYDDSSTAKNYTVRSDGPGTLQDYAGTDGLGLWILTLEDNALNHTNQVGASLYITPYNNNALYTVNPYSFIYKSFIVEDDVIAVNITISEIDPELSLELYVLKDVRPTRTEYDYMETISPPGRMVTITRDDIPALETGLYWLGVYNPNAVDVEFELDIEFVRGFTIGDDQGTPSEYTPLELQDDSYTLLNESFTNYIDPESGETILVPVIKNSIITVPDDREVDNVNVGVRLDHPRISDLSLYLVSPAGTSVLLSENRGWNATNAAPDEDLVPNDKNNSTYGSGSLNGKDGKTTYAFFSSDTNYLLRLIKFEVPPYTNNGAGLPIYYSKFEDVTPGVYAITNPMIISDDFEWLLYGSTNTNIVWLEDTQELQTNLTTVTNFRTWVWEDPEEAYSGTNFLISSRTVLQAEFSGLESDTNYILRLPFKRPEPLSGMVAWWKAENDYLDSEWNLPLEAGSGYSWPAFDTNGMVDTAFGLTNAYLTAKAPNILSTVCSNFTVEGWFKINTDEALQYANNPGGPTMPLFEFTQLVTNYWTNIISVEGEPDEEEVYEIVSWERGMSAWLKGSIWTNGYQRLLPHGSMLLELGTNSVNGETESVIVNLAGTGTPSTADYLNTFTNWIHLAIAFDSESEGDTLRVYSNGNLMLEQTWSHGYIIPNTFLDFNLGYGNELGYSIDDIQPVYHEATFTGAMDEFSWYSRGLEEEEILEIVSAASMGKAGMPHPPISVSIGAKVTIRQVGATTNMFQASLPDITSEWQVGKGRFHTPVVEEGDPDPVYEVIIDVVRGTVAFDDISITTQGVAYEPEVSLNNFSGENAKGDWQLLVWDNRVGATNPTPVLYSWTLDLGYTATNVAVIDLNEENNYSYSGSIKGTNTVDLSKNEVQTPETLYFRVFVPSWATAATNILQGSANMFMAGRWAGVPKFDRGLDDYLWTYTAPDETNYVLTTNISSQASLIPGGRYYLALRDQVWSTNTSTYSIKVDFGQYEGDIPEGVITLTNQVPYIVDPDEGGGRNSVDYYHFSIDDESVAASFLVYDATTNVTMVVCQGLPLPTDSVYDYRAATGTYGYAQIMIYTNSTPIALSAGDWFIGVYNGGYSSTESFDPVGYKILATQYTNNVPSAIELASGVPVSGTLLPGETQYYQYTVTSDAISLWTQVDQVQGVGLNVYNKFGLPLPDAVNRFYEFAVDEENNLDWWLNTSETNTYPLVAGGWYYALENTSTESVDYRIRVTEFSVDPSSIIWLQNGIAETNAVGLIPDGTDRVYYGFDVTTNGVGCLFDLFDCKNGTARFYSLAGMIPNPDQSLYWTSSEEGLTNVYMRLSAWSGALTSGYWFLTALNTETLDDPTEAANVTYQIRASEYEAPTSESIVNLENGYPVQVQNAPIYSEAYYHYATSKNPEELTFTISNVTDMVSAYLLNVSPTNGPTISVYPISWVGPFGATITLNTTDSSVLLEPGDWYLVIENTSLYPVGYDVMATEVGASTDKPIDIGYEYDAETGIFYLVWASVTGATYEVRGSTDVYATPVVWKLIDSVVATDTVTKYLLTQELMNTYSFFSVKKTDDPSEPSAENIVTYGSYQSDVQMLNLSWEAISGSTYWIEGKVSSSDTDWTQIDSVTSTSSAMMDYSIPSTSEYTIARVTPSGGVTEQCIHTDFSYDSDAGKLVLNWNATVGLNYIICGWTNNTDYVSNRVAKVEATSTNETYPVKLADFPGCSYFSVQNIDEQVTLSVKLDIPNSQIVLSWNTIVGNSYRLEGATSFGGSDYTEIETFNAVDSTQMEYTVSMDSGYVIFRIVCLGGSEPTPTNPDFISEIKLDSANNKVVITLDAEKGDVFQFEYCDDLSEGVWSESGGETQAATADGPYTVEIALTSDKAKFFRVIKK